MQRGLEFIYATAADETGFAEYGSDYLWCFYSIAATAADPDLRHRALILGRRLAHRWLALERPAPVEADADQVADQAMALEASEGLGVRDDAFRARLEARIPDFDAEAYLAFEPADGPPPIQRLVLSGADACLAAGRPDAEPEACAPVEVHYPDLEIWYDALISTYFGERFGVQLGMPYAELMRLRRELLPYRTREQLGESAYYDLVYLVTHFVYTLNHYGQARLDPSAYPHEYAFLKSHLSVVVADGDTETYAEFVDTLKSFGATPETEPQLAVAIDSLLEVQSPEGAWGDVEIEDAYDKFHPTWTAIDALKDYHWAGPDTASRRVRFP